jgi:hypothetical protein
MFGPPRFLNADEEVLLSDWLNAQDDPPTITQLLECATQIRQTTLFRITPMLESIGCPKLIPKLWEECQEKSRTWGRAIAIRLDFKFQMAEALEMLRSRYATAGLVSRWFDQMEPHLAGIDPLLLFNFDEIMVSASDRQKVFTTPDKKAFRRKGCDQPHITLGLCVSAFGDGPPHLFIFQGKRKPRDFEELERAGKVCIMNSENGWMTADLFTHWATIFAVWVTQYRIRIQQNNATAVLLIDNCRTHCTLPALEILAAHNIKVITFPPHMTHVLQPIDVACARAYKSILGRKMAEFEKHPHQLPHSSTTSQAAHKRAILLMGSLAALQHCDMSICLNGFEECGLYPFSKNRALASRYVSQSANDPEANDRNRRPNILHCGSSVLTSPEFLEALRQWNTQIPTQ